MTDTNPIEVKSSDPEPSAVPVGFRFAGVRCGIKQARDDLGVMLCDRPAAAAGCFTRNKAPAPCVVRNASLLPSAKVHALVVNSGCANSMTGVEGVRANDAMASLLAELLGVPASGVLTASTGIIGVPLASDLVSEAVPGLIESAGHDPMALARAIVTTDTCTKVAHAQLVLPGSDTPVKILGVAKGSGMIHPNMATTFGFVCTDAIVPPKLLQRLLSDAVDETFNAITVDGDTSTNDMVIALAGGGSGVDVEADDKAGPFAAALRGVLLSLAKQVARDGEGATRLLEVEISALDMTLYDPDGPRLGVNTNKLRAGLRQTNVSWRVDLQQGDASATAYGCDLSYDYVRINADEAKQIEVSRAGGVSRNLTLAAYSPRLRHQLLCEGLAYVRRFAGLKILVYLQRQDGMSDPIASLARDLELCLDAGLKPLAILPDEAAVQTIAEHMRHCGHFAAQVPPDAHTIANYLDRRHLCLMVEHAPAPDVVVDLALKLGIQKLIALGNDQGLRDSHGFVQRLSPDTFLAGLERGRFDASDADLLVLARHAANRGVPALHIIDARVPHAVVGELFTDEGIGTLITRQALA
jgi:N-acetylglutamate synthase/N-acetylornithine aminotransferase